MNLKPRPFPYHTKARAESCAHTRRCLLMPSRGDLTTGEAQRLSSRRALHSAGLQARSYAALRACGLVVFSLNSLTIRAAVFDRPPAPALV